MFNIIYNIFLIIFIIFFITKNFVFLQPKNTI